MHNYPDDHRLHPDPVDTPEWYCPICHQHYTMVNCEPGFCETENLSYEYYDTQGYVNEYTE